MPLTNLLAHLTPEEVNLLLKESEDFREKMVNIIFHIRSEQDEKRKKLEREIHAKNVAEYMVYIEHQFYPQNVDKNMIRDFILSSYNDMTDEKP